MKNKNTIGEQADIVVKHQFYKPKSKELVRLKRLKNILLFGLYIGAVAVIVNFANGNQIKQAFASSIEQVNFDDDYSKHKTKFNFNTLSMEEKLQLKFIGQYMHNDQAASALFLETRQQNVDIYTMLALIKAESNFNVKAVNYNKNGSIDRGLCQLNSFVFKDLSIKDFFEPEINIHYGVKHLRWCLDQSDSNLIKALAMYNAGYGSVTKTKVGEKTLNYIQIILDNINDIKKEEKEFIAKYEDLLK